MNNPNLNFITQNSKKFTNQLLIEKNLPASSTNGSLVNLGLSNLSNVNITGDYAVNDVKITPNKEDIIKERYFNLNNNISEWADIADLKFTDSVTSSFTATINITVTTNNETKNCILILNAVKKDTWKYTTSFSGDITGVVLRVSDKNIDDVDYCQIQYTNSNTQGTSKICVRASTNSWKKIPYNETNTNIITNSFTNGNLKTNSLLYVDSQNKLASSDIKYINSSFVLGTSSNLLITNSSEFTSFTSGSSLIVNGDMQIDKNLIIHESGSLSINTTKTSAKLNLGFGNSINITGDIIKNDQVIVDTKGYSNFDTIEVNSDGVKLLTPLFTTDYGQIGVDDENNLFFNNTATRNSVWQGLKFQTGYSHAIKNKLQLINNNGTPRVNIGGHDTFSHTLSLSTDSAVQPTSNVWITSSDSRLKTEIELADLDLCTQNIMNLPLKRWSWKDDYLLKNKIYDKNALGLIAQDVEEIFPKSVHYDILTYEPPQFDTTGNLENIDPNGFFTDINGDTISNTVLIQQEQEFIQNEIQSLENAESYTYASLKTVDSDQIFWSLYGTVQKLMENVELIKNNI